MTMLERLRWEDGLRVGAAVVAWWGYGFGFRARGRGVIDAVFPKSFRVRLTEEASGTARGSVGSVASWPAGFVLKGIPRTGAERWHPNLCVEPQEPLGGRRAAAPTRERGDRLNHRPAHDREQREGSGAQHDPSCRHPV